MSSELDPLLARQDHRQLSYCCKLSYKPRKFSSKGALLVLVWYVLAVSAFPQHTVSLSISSKLNISFSVLSILVLLVACVFVGWLADVRCGRLRVVKAGLLLMWLGELVLNVFHAFSFAFPALNTTPPKIVDFAGSVCTAVGGVAFIINIMQFGLEQIPDSSSVGITAFISWFVIATLFGYWLQEFSINLLCFWAYPKPACFLIQLCTKFALLSIAMCSMFLFGHWLIDHRQNRNPLKTVYRVLKFAKQHKYPVNRSAFTYCEDEIPSRIDLGKSKYGGPFTTEEVEDVKTFFRILVFLATVVSAISILFGVVFSSPYLGSGDIVAIYSYMLVIPVVTSLLYELLLYPVMKCRLSMMVRIGCCVFCSILVSLVLLAFTLVYTLGPNDVKHYLASHLWITLIFNVFYWFIGYVFMTSLLEFVYSQSPEHMKGFLIGTVLCVMLFVLLIFEVVVTTLKGLRTKENFAIYWAASATVCMLVVFVVYCCVARWYKRRERDEPCNERAIIEEIYGRHVEQNSIEETD